MLLFENKQQQKPKIEKNKTNTKGKVTISSILRKNNKEIWKNTSDIKKSKWSKKECKKSLIHIIHWKKASEL